MNSLLKVLCSLMNDRLVTYSTKHKLINREQIGFQQNSRTSDHILSLKTLVNKYGEKQKTKRRKNFMPASSISKKHLIQSGMKDFFVN